MVDKHSQRGAAAIELAFSMILLMMLLFAVLSYGALFWAQQKMSHLAGEGARTAVAAYFQSQDQAVERGCARIDQIQQTDVLLASLSGVSCVSGVAPCAFANTFQCATLTVSGQVSGWPLLNIMRGLASVFTSDSSDFVPETLSAQAVVQLSMNAEP